MNASLPSPESKTPPIMNITHELADRSRQKWESYTARDLQGNVSFKLQISDASLDGEFAIKEKKR